MMEQIFAGFQSFLAYQSMSGRFSGQQHQQTSQQQRGDTRQTRGVRSDPDMATDTRPDNNNKQPTSKEKTNTNKYHINLFIIKTQTIRGIEMNSGIRNQSTKAKLDKRCSFVSYNEYFWMSYLSFHRSLISIKCSCEVTNAFTPQLTILVRIINSLFNCIPLSYLTKIFCCSKIFCCFSPSNLADAINNELRNRESWCQKYSKTKDQFFNKQSWLLLESWRERTEKKMNSNIQI